jgi:hypothetical protein
MLALVKYSSLLQTFVNYRQKSLIIVSLGANVIKLFCLYFTIRKKLECSSWQAFPA